jgi:hypothetical protein
VGPASHGGMVERRDALPLIGPTGVAVGGSVELREHCVTLIRELVPRRDGRHDERQRARRLRLTYALSWLLSSRARA